MKRACIFLLLWLGACGYRFTTGGAPLPEGISTVCAPVFVNKTAEPGVEVFFTQAMRERLLEVGRLGEKNCRGRIEGEVVSVSGAVAVVTASSATLPNAVASYRLHGTLLLKLYEGDRLVTQTTVAGAEDYLPALEFSGDILRTEANRQTALRRLAEAMARDGYGRLASGW